MESSIALRSVHCPLGMTRFLHRRPAIACLPSGNWHPLKLSCVSDFVVGVKPNSYSKKQSVTSISCVKISESTVAAKSDDSCEDASQGSLEKKTSNYATFPSGFEDLILEVCDETEIAEVQLKIGDIEMHLKRNVGATKSSSSNLTPTIAPPIPSEPMNASVTVAAADVPSLAPSKFSPEKSSPFTNVSFGKSRKLTSLEASGIKNYTLIYSPAVGKFCRGRMTKGRTLPPLCKEGGKVKEGQVIGYVFICGRQVPVKSDTAGEVLKLLVDDQVPVGYGDPLIAILPLYQ